MSRNFQIEGPFPYFQVLADVPCFLCGNEYSHPMIFRVSQWSVEYQYFIHFIFLSNPKYLSKPKFQTQNILQARDKG